MWCLGLVCASLLAASVSFTNAAAETVEEFYKGKTITVIVIGATGSVSEGEVFDCKKLVKDAALCQSKR